MDTEVADASLVASEWDVMKRRLRMFVIFIKSELALHFEYGEDLFFSCGTARALL